ncbi:MAG: TlpA family protein disulfide reductase [Anaerolineaceae bacterium]|nr:TlpA family protein disulfide reductase [Anaerolineaceae bacterium]
MKPIFNKISLFSLLLIFLTSVWVLFTIATNQEKSVEIYSAPQKGFIAPDFVLNDLSGNEYQLSNLKGNMIIVNVWASWCKPCQYEMPALQKIYEKYKDRGLILLAVNNTYQDNYADVLDFVSENNLTFPILLDLDGFVSTQYQVQALPSTFFIDKTGKISEIIIGGPMSETLIESKIKELEK